MMLREKPHEDDRMALTRIFIDGDQGTTGLQIHGRLHERTDMTLQALPDMHRKDRRRRADALNDCDIAILCLPDDAAREAVVMLENPSVRVLDASSAHRVESSWVYGFPEMNSDQVERIKRAHRVTNPGCYPTGAIALLRPLVGAGLVPPDYPLSIHAISGYSGGGRPAVELYEGEASAQAPAFQVYALALKHKHVPEIQRYAGLSTPPVFVPAYGAYRQGIVLSIPLHQNHLPIGVDSTALHACLTQQYVQDKHIRVLPLLSSSTLERLDPQELNGTNDMDIAVFSNPESGQILLTAIFDNLGKGAAGAAVQNLNIMLGSH